MVTVSTFVLIKTYFPSFVVTTVSFGSLCIPVVDFAARIVIPLACLVCLVIIYEDSLELWTTDSPINFWICICMGFVCGVIVEFFIALREYTKKTKEGRGTEMKLSDYRDKERERTMSSMLKADKWSRVIFPISFAIFIIIYAIVAGYYIK